MDIEEEGTERGFTKNIQTEKKEIEEGSQRKRRGQLTKFQKIEGRQSNFKN